MNTNTPNVADYEKILIEKIRTLPTDKKAEVEDFVNFLHFNSDDRQLTRAAARISEKVFSDVWDNPEDAEYDRL